MGWRYQNDTWCSHKGCKLEAFVLVSTCCDGFGLSESWSNLCQGLGPLLRNKGGLILGCFLAAAEDLDFSLWIYRQFGWKAKLPFYFFFFKGSPELFCKLFCGLHYAILTVSCCIRNYLKHLIKVGYQFQNKQKEALCVLLWDREEQCVSSQKEQYFKAIYCSIGWYLLSKIVVL